MGHAQLCPTLCNPWTVACQASLSMEFTRQEYWSGLPFPSPNSSVGKKICLQCRKPRFDSWVRKIHWRREWQPTPVFLPAEFHGQRSLTGYSLWGCKELDTTERLTYTHQLEVIRSLFVILTDVINDMNLECIQTRLNSLARLL